MKPTLRSHLLAVLFTVCAIAVRMLNPTNLKLAFSMLDVVSAVTILIVFCGCVVRRNIKPTDKYSVTEHIGFAVFAFFETLHYIYGKSYSINDLNWIMALYCIVSLCINYILAQYGYECIKHFTQKTDISERKNQAYWKYFLTFAIPYTIMLLINYPGMIMYDSMMQILQAFNLPNPLADQAVLINPDVLVTTHHPFIHTMLIKFFLWIGECVGSLDFGMFLHVWAQCLGMAALIAYILHYVQAHIPSKAVRFWSVVFALNPIVLMYSILITKDTIFACLFAIFAIRMYEYAKNHDVIKQKKWWFSFLAITLAASMFRNNFMYAAAISLIYIVIRHTNKKYMVGLLATYLCIFFAYSSILIPALGVSNGSIREVISVPFQQTANYVQHHELTEEEYEVISQVLNVEAIKEAYNPEVSNNVKNTFNKEATKEELVDYLVTWGKMFFKHPKAYFDAYFNMFYGYFSTGPVYTAAYNSMIDDAMRQHLSNAGVDLPQYQSIFRPIWSGMTFAFQLCPVLYLITNGGVYTWVIAATILCLLRRKQKHMLIMYLPFILYFATLLISPANATQEYRYMFPYLIAMPVFLLPVYNTNPRAQESALSKGE